eukprot:TRINITY_DN26628_c0_g1_i1.p1 TRINITY_DN26628_c0_g1~~TRINITY_DN26628_c0_g1_i1.p1  ORF type:complete len:106 (-),score=0.25 TRINITY_DN26628_c0_g1_i1:6-323(-)
MEIVISGGVGGTFRKWSPLYKKKHGNPSHTICFFRLPVALFLCSCSFLPVPLVVGPSSSSVRVLPSSPRVSQSGWLAASFSLSLSLSPSLPLALASLSLTLASQR